MADDDPALAATAEHVRATATEDGDEIGFILRRWASMEGTQHEVVPFHRCSCKTDHLPSLRAGVIEEAAVTVTRLVILFCFLVELDSCICTCRSTCVYI